MSISTSKTARMWGEMVVSIFRLNTLFLSLGNEIARPAGQTSARWFVLAAAYMQPQTVSQIARRMGVSRQGVQRTADLLWKENFLIFRENKEHKNANLVELTEKGRKAMEAIAKEQKIWAEQWIKKIGTENLEATLANLKRIEEVCRKTSPIREVPRAAGKKRRFKKLSL